VRVFSCEDWRWLVRRRGEGERGASHHGSNLLDVPDNDGGRLCIDSHSGGKHGEDGEQAHGDGGDGQQRVNE